MILQSLVNYYETLVEKGEIARPGWSTAKVSYALEISQEGCLKAIVPLKQEEQRGKKTVLVPQQIKVPQMVTRSSGVSANFLCDNAGYFLGIDSKGKPERAIQCFEAAKEKHLQILKNENSSAATAVKNYFKTWNPKNAETNELVSEVIDDLMKGANLIFSFHGMYVQDDSEIRHAWENARNEESNGETGRCLVTGNRDVIARIHTAIKGVQGAQSSGAALVSFNAPAFESYGKEQSYNAPVGEYAVYAYTTALNYLLSNSRSHTRIGDTTIVYWAENGEEEYQDFFSMSTEPSADNQETIHGIFQNLAKWRGVDVNGVINGMDFDQKFYILGITPNAARLAVRFFYQDSFGNILTHIKEHYDRMEIVKPANDIYEYLGLWRMLQETVNKKSRSPKPEDNVAGAVLKAVISGERYPAALYHSVIGRIRAEQDNSDTHTYKITRGRAAIIKTYLLRNCNGNKEEITVALNENSQSTAYNLGCMFSVLEAIQQDANPGINSTIKDRYFNSACATPASIFPILFKLKNSHIRKMDGQGKIVYYEKMLGALQNKFIVADEQKIAYPRRLSLEEQGMFILGYYQQTQKRFEKKEDK